MNGRPRSERTAASCSERGAPGGAGASRRAWAMAGALALGAACARADAPIPNVLMPLPQQCVLEGEGCGLARLRTAAIEGLASGSPESARLAGALQRLEARWRARAGTAVPSLGAAGSGQAELRIRVLSELPRATWRQDEHYTLQVAPGGIDLTADTAVGALRGLATLTQLLSQTKTGAWIILGARIDDAPRFPWRGLLIDVGRHFEPVDVIQRELDGMELVKLNVLHLHLTEDQGFRIESRTHPELARMGSDGLYYTQDEVRGLIRYAWERGIRVMPEFDLPGHVTALAVSHPELVSAPGTYRIERKWGVFDPTLDPTNPRLYPFLDSFLGEMAALFPDPFLHVGGDENDGVQWNANAHIQAFIRDHHLAGDAGLQTYFEQKVSQILTRHHKRMVGWDEILQPGLPRNSVIESWRGADGVTAAAKAGHDVILAHGYYIDLSRPAAEHYANDPLPPDSGLSAEEAAHVLGGEATMWGEWVCPSTIDTRIWPRTAAIAERLWSPASVRDPADMYRRLAIVDRRLAEAGLQQHQEPAEVARKMAGPDAPPRVVSAIVAVCTALAPVQDYQRGKVQPEMDQLHPLTTMADVAVPDGAAARNFNADAARYAAHPTPAVRLMMYLRLSAWTSAARRALDFAEASRDRDLAAASAQVLDAGDQALAALHLPHPIAPVPAADDPHTGTFLAIAPGVSALGAHP